MKEIKEDMKESKPDNDSMTRVVLLQQSLSAALGSAEEGTESHRLIKVALEQGSKIGNSLYKKGLLKGPGLTFEEYSNTSKKGRSNPEEIITSMLERDDLYLVLDLLNGATGMSAKSGEVLDHIRKVVFTSIDIDNDKVADLLSDIIWYLALITTGLRIDFQGLMVSNLKKLRDLGRLPSAKQDNEIINQKLEEERRLLEDEEL